MVSFSLSVRWFERVSCVWVVPNFYSWCSLADLSGPAKGLIPAALIKLSMLPPLWACLLLFFCVLLRACIVMKILFITFIVSSVFYVFPPAVNAGNNAAKGKIPPFWRLFLLLTVDCLLLGMVLEWMRIHMIVCVVFLCVFCANNFMMKSFIVVLYNSIRGRRCEICNGII